MAMVDLKHLQTSLPTILDEFNEVLKKHGIEKKVIRFMLGNPDDPQEREAQDKINRALEDLFAKQPSSPNEYPPDLCFECCDTEFCYPCYVV